DLSPGGDTLVAVQDAPGERRLVLVHLVDGRAASIDPLVSESETQFNAPRWSPDGRLIAVERHRRGVLPEVVVFDVATRRVGALIAAAGDRVVTPAWRPDGLTIVVAVAHEDGVFNLFEVPIDAPDRRRQLTHTTGGATWPDVSPDGRTLAFAGYTTDG